MYWVQKGSRRVLEADACGIGFVATRKGVADRQVIQHGLEMCRRFDHRGAPGHGAGIQVDIPWPLLLDRFPEHVKLVAQRDVALGMFFLPFDATLRRACVAKVEELADLAGAGILQWADVPVDVKALEPGSHALRTLPVVRQALFRRPANMSEEGWFVTRYLLRFTKVYLPCRGSLSSIPSCKTSTLHRDFFSFTAATAPIQRRLGGEHSLFGR
jgi:glutamate synthase domain-containing protein 1